MFHVVIESEKLKKIALTRRMLVSFGAVSTNIYLLVTGVPHLDPQVLFPAWHSPQVLLHHEPLLPEVPLVLLVVLVLLVRIFWLVLFTDKSRVLGEFSCQSERDTFKFTLTFFPETEKFLHHLILHESVL